MSKPFRGMSQPQMNHLRPDIVLIEYSDPRAKETHISTVATRPRSSRTVPPHRALPVELQMAEPAGGEQQGAARCRARRRRCACRPRCGRTGRPAAACLPPATFPQRSAGRGGAREIRPSGRVARSRPFGHSSPVASRRRSPCRSPLIEAARPGRGGPATSSRRPRSRCGCSPASGSSPTASSTSWWPP